MILILGIFRQLLDSFIRNLISKLVPLLNADNFKSYSPDCSALVNGTSSDVSTASSRLDPTAFETRLSESVAETPLVQFSTNSTFKLEYYLKVMVFGRDGNNIRLLADESPVLTELAMIDNSAFNIISNVSLKAPRRFFRIGVAQVSFNLFLTIEIIFVGSRMEFLI